MWSQVAHSIGHIPVEYCHFCDLYIGVVEIIRQGADLFASLPKKIALNLADLFCQIFRPSTRSN
ncbi:unnamed protein product [Acidithrix sp. C25]|nr:unnamed protein product [Acidithrix sp. C25]